MLGMYSIQFWVKVTASNDECALAVCAVMVLRLTLLSHTDDAYSSWGLTSVL